MKMLDYMITLDAECKIRKSVMS